MTEELQRSIYDLQARCSRLETMLRDYEAQVQVVSKAALHRDDVNPRLDHIEQCLANGTEEEKKSLQALKTDVSNSFNLADQNFSLIAKAIDNQLNEIQRIQKEIDSCKEKNEICFNTANVNLATLREEVKRETEEKIGSIPTPRIPSQDDIYQAIAFKVEPIALDAKNGVLRSANCEMKIMIMEKKIDQIFLLLQKHSLTT